MKRVPLLFIKLFLLGKFPKIETFHKWKLFFFFFFFNLGKIKKKESYHICNHHFDAEHIHPLLSDNLVIHHFDVMSFLNHMMT
jgi:hypothetical protein